MEKEVKTTVYDLSEIMNFANQNLNGYNYKLYINIAMKCNVNENKWIHSDKQWMQELNISKRAFYKAKKYLEENGYIQNLNKGKKNNVDSNEITIYSIEISKFSATPTAKNAPTPTAKNAPTPTAKNAPTPTAKNAPLNKDNKKENKKEYNCSTNRSCTTGNHDKNVQKIEDLEMEHSYLTEEDNRIFQMRQQFIHINEENEVWVDKYMKTLQEIDEVLLTSKMRDVITTQLKTLYNDRPNDNFNDDFKIYNNRLQCPHIMVMNSTISQAERNAYNNAI